MENEEFQIPQNAQEAEAIVNSLGNASEEGTEIHTKEPEAAKPQLFKLNYRGKEEEYPIEKVLSFAQQGRDYNERMALFNRDRALFDAERQKSDARYKGLEDRLKQYGEIEAYQKQDPAWWQHVVQSYQQARSQGQAQVAQLPPEVQKEIEENREFRTRFEEREQAEVIAKEDQALELEISQYREKNPAFEWEKVDEHGFNLEQRILNHATKLGLTKPEHFKLAAFDLLQDEILKRKEHEAKEGVGKHLEKVTKLGMGPVTERRTLGVKPVRNVAEKDWNEIAEEAKAAIGIT